MSASSKFGFSSSSPDGFLYASGLCGSHGAAAMDRASSFRESLDSSILPSPPDMIRVGSSAIQGDIVAFLQCLRFDPKQMVTNHKLNQPVDFKHLACLSLGVPEEGSSSMPSKRKSILSPSPEEFRQLKAALRESCTKARERIKIFNESLLGMNKLFPTIPSRKRSWSDVSFIDRSNYLCYADRSVSRVTIAKVGSQSQATINGTEAEQKSEERAKGVSNKRTRSSMVDAGVGAKANLPARTSGMAENNREVSKSRKTSSVENENRILPVAVDGWEKSKTKKKRSGIKSDVVASSVPTKPFDGSREPKQGMQRQDLTDPRSRMIDNKGVSRTSCQPGIANGVVAKVDGSPPQMLSGMRASGSRLKQDSSSLLHDKKGHSFRKEEVNLKVINKSNAPEDLSTGSPTLNTKVNVTSRALRSGSKVEYKLPRSTSINDLKISHSASKLAAAVGTNNRKHTHYMRSSSPPVGQWTSHRPQKISKTARRTSFVSLCQSNHGSSPLEATSVAGSERCLPGSSPHMGKMKTDPFHSDLKPKKKTKQSDGIDENSGQNVQQFASQMLPPRENKIVNQEEPGDEVSRQGRSRQIFTPTRSSMPLAVKKHKFGMAKQLRSVTIGSDETERKMAYPSTRKLSDCKAYFRQKHTMVNVKADFLDDGHEELLVATDAVTNSAEAFSCSFWEQMEPSFRSIAEGDLAFLRRQVNLKPAMASLTVLPSGFDKPSLVANRFGLRKLERGVTTESAENSHQILSSQNGTVAEISLYQRLIAALIPEEDNELCCDGNVDLRFDLYDSGYEMEIDVNTDDTQILQNFDFSGHPTLNGYKIGANGRLFSEMEHAMLEDNVTSIPDAGFVYDNFQKGLRSDHPPDGSICSEFQYNNMSINERLLLEIHCIGIFPEVLPLHSGFGEIAEEITKVNEKYLEQVSTLKSLLGRLLKSADETRVLQEKKFEQAALDKLVGMAYGKYMTCWGPNAHGMKSASGRMAKQSALAFVQRTLDRCQEFESTEKSCFGQPLFMNMFLSGVSQLDDGHTADSNVDGGSVEVHTKSCGGSVEARASGLQSSSLNLAIEQATVEEETLSSRVKKMELLLNDVGGGVIGTSPDVTLGIGSSFSSSTKGKRSERDREGKEGSREGLYRSGTTKKSQPKSANTKGERKSKTKSKQMTTRLSASVNGCPTEISAKPKEKLPSTTNLSDTTPITVVNNAVKHNLDELEDPIDLSNLQIPEALGVPDELGDEGQDIGSWLNIDDDGLQDLDFVGLQIPIDDLSDLKMMV